jgi:hypothetical protein
MSAVQRQPLPDSQDNAGTIARYDAELLRLTETEPAQPNRLLYGLLTRDPSTWVYTDEQKAKDAARWVEPLCIAWTRR